ncbi:MAG TPA: response regulator transcription factor [Candidatus Baltobacteraceae bacterium]|jgi:DNA-binding NarL/FixJ family response regulator|nr:response regulator transcription factor [Candidatus Baltobacteraceae bacterium]
MKTSPSSAAVPASVSTAKKNPTRIVIVDDHPLLRKGVGQLINNEKDLMVVGEAEDAAKALTAIESSRPDVALIDISLGGASGIELLKNIKARFPKLQVLVLSMHDESVYAHRALRAGASGYIMKQEATEKVLTALRKVLRGEVYLSERLGARMLNTLVGGRSPSGTSPIEALSDRELEVFSLIGQGHGTRPIAEKLHLSVKTIESHRAHIKEKLNLQTATELVHHAIQWVQSERVVGAEAAHSE